MRSKLLLVLIVLFSCALFSCKENKKENYAYIEYVLKDGSDVFEFSALDIDQDSLHHSQSFDSSMIKKYNGKEKNVILPNYVQLRYTYSNDSSTRIFKDSYVYGIGKSAFKENEFIVGIQSINGKFDYCIAEEAFMNCKNLTSLPSESGMVRIFMHEASKKCFYGTNVTSSKVSLAVAASYSMANITGRIDEVVLERNNYYRELIYVYDYAFSNSNIDKIVINHDQFQFSENAFSGLKDGVKVYYYGTVSSFEQAYKTYNTNSKGIGVNEIVCSDGTYTFTI